MTETLEQDLIAATERFPAHDFHLHYVRREKLWTAAASNNIEDFAALGRGNTPSEAVRSLMPVPPSPANKRGKPRRLES